MPQFLTAAATPTGRRRSLPGILKQEPQGLMTMCFALHDFDVHIQQIGEYAMDHGPTWDPQMKWDCVQYALSTSVTARSLQGMLYHLHDFTVPEGIPIVNLGTGSAQYQCTLSEASLAVSISNLVLSVSLQDIPILHDMLNTLLMDVIKLRSWNDYSELTSNIQSLYHCHYVADSGIEEAPLVSWFLAAAPTEAHDDCSSWKMSNKIEVNNIHLELKSNFLSSALFDFHVKDGHLSLDSSYSLFQQPQADGTHAVVARTSSVFGGSLALEVASFSVTRKVWLPVLESAALHWGYSVDDESRVFKLRCDEAINLNICPETVRLVSAAAALSSNDGPTLPKKIIIYQLRNLSGLNVSVHVDGGMQQNVLEGASVEFARTATPHTMALVFQNPLARQKHQADACVFTFPVHELGYFCERRVIGHAHDQSELTLDVVCEITSPKVGQVEIQLRSPMAFYNSTASIVELLLSAASNTESVTLQSVHVLQPQTSLLIPVHLTQIQFRPQCDETNPQFDWTTPMPLSRFLKLGKSEGKTVYSCVLAQEEVECVSSTNPPFCYLMWVGQPDQRLQLSLSESSMLFSMSVSAPLMFESQLCVPVEVTFAYQSTKGPATPVNARVSAKGTCCCGNCNIECTCSNYGGHACSSPSWLLQALGTVEVFEGEKSKIFLRARLPNSDLNFSDPAIFYEPKGFMSSHFHDSKVELNLSKDSKKRSKGLTVCLERNANLNSVYLYCPYWLVNSAPIPISYRIGMLSKATSSAGEAQEEDEYVENQIASANEKPVDLCLAGVPQLVPYRKGSDHKIAIAASNLSFSKTVDLHDVEQSLFGMGVSLEKDKMALFGQKEKDSKVLAMFGLTVTDGPVNFPRTKVISVAPRIVIYNRLACDLEIRSKDLVVPLEIPRNGTAPLLSFSSRLSVRLRDIINNSSSIPPEPAAKDVEKSKRELQVISPLRKSESSPVIVVSSAQQTSGSPASAVQWNWSGEFEIDPENLNPGMTSLCIRGTAQERRIVHISTKVSGPSILVCFRDQGLSDAAASSSLHFIDNQTPHTLHFHQKEASVPYADAIGAYSKAAFAWDEPLGEQRLMLALDHQYISPYGFDATELQTYKPVEMCLPQARLQAPVVSCLVKQLMKKRKANNDESNEEPKIKLVPQNIVVSVVGQGPIRTLRISLDLNRNPEEPSTSAARRTLSEKLKDTLLHRPVKLHLKPRGQGPKCSEFQVSVDIAGVGISIVDQEGGYFDHRNKLLVQEEEKSFHPVELVYVYFGHVLVQVARVATGKLMKEETVTVNISRVQVDNQLRDAMYQVLLAPRPRRLLAGEDLPESGGGRERESSRPPSRRSSPAKSRRSSPSRMLASPNVSTPTPIPATPTTPAMATTVSTPASTTATLPSSASFSRLLSAASPMPIVVDEPVPSVLEEKKQLDLASDTVAVRVVRRTEFSVLCLEDVEVSATPLLVQLDEVVLGRFIAFIDHLDFPELVSSVRSMKNFRLSSSSGTGATAPSSGSSSSSGNSGGSSGSSSGKSNVMDDRDKIYVGSMLVQQIQFLVSIRAHPVDDNPSVTRLRKLIHVKVPTIEGAPIQWDAFKLIHFFSDYQVAVKLMKKHYSTELFLGLHKILGSLDILGNPMSLFRRVQEGLSDFVVPPKNGHKRNTMEVGKGLARGTAALFSNTIGGVAVCAGKITGGLGDGLALLSFDNDFKLKRKLEPDAHGMEALKRGAKQLGHGFLHGITGVVVEPVKGAAQDGVSGFVKGVGKGLVGVAVKPVTGILDFASSASQGLKPKQQLPFADRIRLPRHFASDDTLTAYSRPQAEGGNIWVQLEQYGLEELGANDVHSEVKERLLNHWIVDNSVAADNDHMLALTNKRLFYLVEIGSALLETKHVVNVHNRNFVVHSVVQLSLMTRIHVNESSLCLQVMRKQKATIFSKLDAAVRTQELKLQTKLKKVFSSKAEGGAAGTNTEPFLSKTFSSVSFECGQLISEIVAAVQDVYLRDFLPLEQPPQTTTPTRAN